MLDTKLDMVGTILMHDGHIHIDGFGADECGCREVAIHAMLWAIGELQREIAADIAKPGGSGKVGIGLPPQVRKALGLLDPWAMPEDE